MLNENIYGNPWCKKKGAEIIIIRQAEAEVDREDSLMVMDVENVAHTEMNFDMNHEWRIFS